MRNERILRVLITKGRILKFEQERIFERKENTVTADKVNLFLDTMIWCQRIA